MKLPPLNCMQSMMKTCPALAYYWPRVPGASAAATDRATAIDIHWRNSLRLNSLCCSLSGSLLRFSAVLRCQEKGGPCLRATNTLTNIPGMARMRLYQSWFT